MAAAVAEPVIAVVLQPHQLGILIVATLAVGAVSGVVLYQEVDPLLEGQPALELLLQPANLLLELDVLLLQLQGRLPQGQDLLLGLRGFALFDEVNYVFIAG